MHFFGSDFTVSVYRVYCRSWLEVCFSIPVKHGSSESTWRSTPFGILAWFRSVRLLGGRLESGLTTSTQLITVDFSNSKPWYSTCCYLIPPHLYIKFIQKKEGEKILKYIFFIFLSILFGLRPLTTTVDPRKIEIIESKDKCCIPDETEVDTGPFLPPFYRNTWRGQDK